MDKFRLDKTDCALLVLDVQESLAQVMQDRLKVVGNILHLTSAASLMGLPVLLTEQYPKGLGHTVPEILESIPNINPVEKLSFDATSEPVFLRELFASGMKKIILCGMETHICVLQTALGLMDDGYDVHVASDAVCSRTEQNHAIGLQYMRSAGAVISSTETVLFQLLKKAGTDEFRAISKRIK